MRLKTERIRFSCPLCGRAIATPREAAGKQGRCPACKKAIVVPAATVTEPNSDSRCSTSAISKDISDEETIQRLGKEGEAYLRGDACEGASVHAYDRLRGLSTLEIRIEDHARMNRSIGPIFDALVAELIRIGLDQGFICRTKARAAANSKPAVEQYDDQGRHIRVKQIGDFLSRRWGVLLMQAAYYRVRQTQADAADLSACWDGISEWTV